MFVIKGKNPKTNKHVVQVKNNKTGEIVVNEQFSTNTAALAAMSDMTSIVSNWGHCIHKLGLNIIQII